MSTRYRYAPAGWQAGHTKVRYVGRTQGLTGEVGTFVGNSQPLPGVTPRSWLGVLVQFPPYVEPLALDIDPALLEVVED